MIYNFWETIYLHCKRCTDCIYIRNIFCKRLDCHTKGKDKYTFKFACVDELNVVAEVALFVGIIRSCLPGTDIISILSSRGLEISDKELAVAMNRT